MFDCGRSLGRAFRETPLRNHGQRSQFKLVSIVNRQSSIPLLNVNSGSGFRQLKPPLSEQNRPASVRQIRPFPESASADFALVQQKIRFERGEAPKPPTLQNFVFATLVAANSFAGLLNRTDVTYPSPVNFL